jgi:heavy metal translocating P-type ATPase
MKTVFRYVNLFDIILVPLLLITLLLDIFILDYFNLRDINAFSYFILIVAIAGTLPVIYSAYKALINRRLSVDLLASVALVFSLLAHEWTSAIFINMMLTSARIFMSYNEGRARKNIDSLLKLRPQVIKVKRGTDIIELSPKDVLVGDIVIVDLGERLPIDGIVVSGEADVDESSLTGESMPVFKKEGSRVFAATLVNTGQLEIKAEKVGTDTTLEKIIKLVESAQLEKPNIHTMAEKFATWYLIIVFVGAILTYILTGNLLLVLSIMLVVCADDVAVAVPLTFLTAISYSAKRGIIIKGASYLEVLNEVKTIYFDKTGTLTEGKLKIERYECIDGTECQEFMRSAGILAGLSDHPVSKAIYTYVKENYDLDSRIPNKIQEIPGKGMIGGLSKSKILLGRLSFAKELNFTISDEIIKKINADEDLGFNVTVVGINEVVQGYFVVADKLKENISSSLQKMKDMGIKELIMLTGDNERVAKRITATLGLSGYHANLLPAQKLEIIREKMNSGVKVAMIGDGVNDAAAITLANVGIAMGAIGMDTAIESADIILMKDDLSKISELMAVAKYSLKIANQDFLIWGFTNVIGLWLVLISVFGPTGASMYNFLTDFLPLLNSVRIFSLYLRK